MEDPARRPSKESSTPSIESVQRMSQSLRRSHERADRAAIRKAWYFMERLDFLAEKNGLRTASKPTAQQTRKEPAIFVENFSSVATILGTIVSVAVLLIFTVSIFIGYVNNVPVVNQVASESINIEYDVPDVAITVNMEATEEEIKRLFVPEFYWVQIKDGMRNRQNAVRNMTELQSGEACKLRAGYRRDEVQGDQGNISWPVFCILNSKEKLRGRFGDPQWNFFQVKLSDCNANTTSTGCAPKHERDAELDKGLGINIWFRFQRQDWHESGGLKQAEGAVPGGWNWYIYHKLWLRNPTGLQIADVINMELRSSSAKVNSPLDFPGLGINFERKFNWWSFGGWDFSPSGTTSSDFETRTLLIVNSRVAAEKYDITVQFMNVADLIGQISGCWGVSLLVGGILVCIVFSIPASEDEVVSDLGPLSELIKEAGRQNSSGITDSGSDFKATADNGEADADPSAKPPADSTVVTIGVKG